MLGEAPAPHRGDLVARLQYCAGFGRLPAANQACVPPALAGQELDDHGALAMAANCQDESIVLPLH
jgi:hypothetical protein